MGCKCKDCNCNNLEEAYRLASHKSIKPAYDIVGGRDNIQERVFYKETNPLDLKWHFDEEDRSIAVEYGEGWFFQFDDELPIELKVGDIIKIKKMTYHRLIKGENSTDLELHVLFKD